jgi:hypothetical protein
MDDEQQIFSFTRTAEFGSLPAVKSSPLSLEAQNRDDSGTSRMQTMRVDTATRQYPLR